MDLAQVVERQNVDMLQSGSMGRKRHPMSMGGASEFSWVEPALSSAGFALQRTIGQGPGRARRRSHLPSDRDWEQTLDLRTVADLADTVLSPAVGSAVRRHAAAMVIARAQVGQ